MIDALRSLDDVNIIIRSFLIEQSEIDEQFVRDAKTTFGPFLDKSNDDEVFESIEHDDTLLLFSVHARQSDSSMTQTLQDDTIVSYKSLRVHLTMYGDNSATIADKLRSRLMTSRVRSRLQINAIYLESVSEINELHEFKASTIWERNDFDIDISCKLIFQQQSEDVFAESVSDIVIYSN